MTDTKELQPLDGEIMPDLVEDGKFLDSLKRNNRKIREDRATAIVEDTCLAYKRAVEDIEMAIKRLTRDQDNMLDLSPTDARSLTLASDFDALDFVAKDIELSIKMRNLKIKLEVAKDRFRFLFGN